MTHNILITGAAGYVGGSVLADFLSRTEGPIKAANLYAAVRSDEQVQALAKLDVHPVKLDLNDGEAISKVVKENKIDLIINTAASWDQELVARLIKALGEQARESGGKVFFIQTSVLEFFTEESGWPAGPVKDTDPLHDQMKEYNSPNPLGATNLTIDDVGEQEGVTTFNVALPNVYGRGTGEWRKLSVNIPAYVRAALEDRVVHKFDIGSTPPGMHISDLTSIYALIVEKALSGETIPNGKEGYYFARSHTIPWWEVMDRIAQIMYKKGLVDTPEVKIWSSLEAAAEKLGFPMIAMKAMTMSSGDTVAVNAYKLGWKPEWDQEKFLKSLEDEVQAVLELDTVKPTLFQGLLEVKP